MFDTLIRSDVNLDEVDVRVAGERLEFFNGLLSSFNIASTNKDLISFDGKLTGNFFTNTLVGTGDQDVLFGLFSQSKKGRFPSIQHQNSTQAMVRDMFKQLVT